MNEDLFEYLYATEQVDDCFGLKEPKENNISTEEESNNISKGPYIKKNTNFNKKK